MVKIKVTVERFNEVIDLADAFDLGKVSVPRAFEYLCMFAVDDAGNYIGLEAGKVAFSKARVKLNEVSKYWSEFIQKVNDAFVPKASGSELDEPT